jgi:pyruvate/2-oxoglutarate dehydrogenase complex dihydrolipoamide acyltransferase (E2) component
VADALTIESPMQGTVVSLEVSPGEAVRAGQALVVLESMKMEHAIAAEEPGVVVRIEAAVGTTVHPGDVLVVLEPAAIDGEQAAPVEEADLDHVRADLAAVFDRTAHGPRER